MLNLIMFIETYILRLLAAVKKYGTLSRVGEELGTTQPSISRAMQKLEVELGVTLFERTKNHVALNEAGVLAADYAEKILSLQDEMIEKTREKAGLKKKFAVGSVAIMPATTVTETAQKLYPGIEARFDINDNEAHLLRALTDDVYQMIVLLHPMDDAEFKSQKYFSERKSEKLFSIDEIISE